MRQKYPKTLHLPWSPGLQNDDRRIETLDGFVGQRVVVTEKLDGENTTLYADGMHARSLDSRHHSSRDWVKQFHGGIAHLIPVGWRVCGENVYAQHSVIYDDLESYFYVFSVWTDENRCLSWDETIAFAQEISAPTPVEFYRGVFDENVLHDISIDTDTTEGFVVRIEETFDFDAFKTSVAKWVRKGHVQTDEHWMHKQVVRNGLRDDDTN